MTLTIKHFISDELVVQYANMHRELYPTLPCEIVACDGRPAVKSPKLLLLGSETFVEVQGEWKNVKEIS